MVQFNGFYGCPYCMTPGETVKTSERGHTHAYPFIKETSNGFGTARTHTMFVNQGTEAENKKVNKKAGNEYGVKGLNWFSYLPYFDTVRGVGIDYMHCVMLGIVKMLMSLWFDKSYKNEVFNISEKLSVVNDRLLNIKPPNFIARLPRTLNDLSHFKAAEYKSFLLYYSLPCLWGVLPDDIFQHYLLLVQSMTTLLGERITLQQLNQCRRMLMHFSINISAIYGQRYMTSNVHLLLHLVDKVKDFGPLWTNSCFYFEDFNGQLRSLFHGTQKIENKIVFVVRVPQNIHKLSSCLSYGTMEEELYRKMTEKKNVSKKEQISDNSYVIGAFSTGPLSYLERHIIELELGPIHTYSYFKRVFKNNVIIHSKSYKCVYKRKSTIVKFGRDNFGEVKNFVKVFQQCPDEKLCSGKCNCKTPHYLAIVDSMTKLNVELSTDNVSGTTVNSTVPVSPPQGHLKVLQIMDICCLCVLIPISKELCFVSTPVNNVEKE